MPAATIDSIVEMTVFTSNVLGRLPLMAIFLLTCVTSGGCATGMPVRGSCRGRGEAAFDATRACRRLSGDQIEEVLRRALAAGYIETRSVSRHGVAEELILASDTVDRILVLGYALTERGIERGIVGSAGMEVLASCISPVFAALAVLFYPSKIASDNEIRCTEEVPASPGEPQKEPDRTFDPAPWTPEEDADRRHPNQTCDNDTLQTLRKEMKAVCRDYGCSGKALKKLRVAALSRTEILARIARGESCLAARERIQEICFKGSPEEGHEIEVQEVRNAIQTCRDSLEAAQST